MFQLSTLNYFVVNLGCLRVKVLILVQIWLEYLNPSVQDYFFGNFYQSWQGSNDLVNRAGKYSYVHNKPPFSLFFMKQNGYFSTQCGAV